MKNLSLVFLLFSFLIIGCEEDCTNLNEIVPGSWSVVNVEIEFLNDGTVIDDSNFVPEPNAVKTWALNGLDLVITADDNGTVTNYTFMVSNFDCEMMTGINTGNTFVFNKN